MMTRQINQSQLVLTVNSLNIFQRISFKNKIVHNTYYENRYFGAYRSSILHNYETIGYSKNHIKKISLDTYLERKTIFDANVKSRIRILLAVNSEMSIDIAKRLAARDEAEYYSSLTQTEKVQYFKL